MRFAFLALLLLLAPPAALPARADFIGHGGMVRAVAISPDGRTVLSAGFDYSARLWDFATQLEARDLVGHTGPVNAAAFVGDGTTALTAGNDGMAILWSVADGRRLATLAGHTDRVMAVAATADGRHAASASWDRTVRIWDLAARREIHRIETPSGATAVAFSQDGATLFSGHMDGGVRVWRAADGAALAAYPRHDMAVTALSTGPGLPVDRLLSASIDGSVRLWDTALGREMIEMKGHDGPVFAVAALPAGKDTGANGPGAKAAVSAGRDGRLVVWDLNLGRQVRAIAAADRPVWGVAASPDGRFALSAGTDGSIRAWHVDSGARIGLPGEADDGPKPWLDSPHPGAKVYRTCAICHAYTAADGRRRSGPHLAGLFGRKAGSVAGYAYSAALAGKDLVWNEDTLFKLFSDGPDTVLPGTKMPVQRVTDSEQLRALIDYLQLLTR